MHQDSDVEYGSYSTGSIIIQPQLNVTLLDPQLILPKSRVGLNTKKMPDWRKAKDQIPDQGQLFDASRSGLSIGDKRKSRIVKTPTKDS